MKNKETLEEVAHEMLVDYGIKSIGQSIGVPTVKKLMVNMAKWQAERMYSEEEVLNILFQWSMYGVDIELDKLVDKLPSILPYNEWFEQFKKK